ncbi:Crp/Fnr family transcriptional regulator [Sphingomonas oryzagri]|jgi:CRP/FNR family transcriptional regulator|uniref:Crp/Fnr family transcriptional regulator n=1 Tax=Sphingomonas oryzagri TaxID=3042314 RepID=A0ABT6MZ12_9SPHN|nr:Crp/Fnr family transcriptional regulator [Sphingomonas oryzagri]MDH7638255.1 Crp/Fnr family transcriptional regulator [Sphingomonas oryzagri]
MSNFSRHRFSALADLAADEKAALAKLAGEPVFFYRNQVLRHEGDACPGLFVLFKGWVGSSIRLGDGNRQFLKVHMPGDVLGAPSLPLTHAADTLVALTDAKVGPVDLNELSAIFARFPRLGILFFLAAQEERIVLMDRLVSVGRLSANQRLATLLIHFHERLVAIDPRTGPEFELPLSQEQIGDIVSLTAVSVNRALRSLQHEGYIHRRGKIIDMADIIGLRNLASLPARHLQRNPSWLPRHSSLKDAPQG